MNITSAIAVAAVLLLPALADTPAEARMLSCSIEASRQGGLLRLVAYASSEVAGEVHSELTVAKRGPSGTSRNRQGGIYAVKAGRRTIVGGVTIGAEGTSDVSATLDVDSDMGTAQCSYPKD